MDALQVLDGTPYSLPPEADESLAEMRHRLQRVRSGLLAALEEARRIGLVREMDRAHAYWSVFESNSIEFTGPDLGGTVEAIESTKGQNALRDLSVNLLPEILREDRKAFAAIGLEMARVLALRYIGTSEVGVRQTDVRSLHSIVMAGSIFAGRYRDLEVEISGSDHHPFAGHDIGRTMQELAEWSRRDGPPEDAILRAAVGHAWFTHVHPFYDGNGRVGRLLTNVLLGQDGLPPAIVKADSQRSQYIAALAHSDEGGDIMPLTGLMLDTVERYVAELRQPYTFKKLFDQLVARRGDHYFDWYLDCWSDFQQRFELELNLVGLQLSRLDRMTADVFSELRRGGGQTVLSSVVQHTDSQEIAIYHRRPTATARARFERDEAVPTIAFALPNNRWSLSPYRRTRRADLEGLVEFWIEPDRPTRVILDDYDGHRSLSVDAAASEIADRLLAGFRRRFTAPDNYFGSARWLPKVNGGPG